MIIKINKDYRIRGSDHCWVVERRKIHQEEGTEYWAGEGYFIQIETAMKYLVDKRVREISDSATAEEVKEALQVIVQECSEALRVFRELEQ